MYSHLNSSLWHVYGYSNKQSDFYQTNGWDLSLALNTVFAFLVL